MGVRLTGISTPIVGASWEYTNKEDNKEYVFYPTDKIKVFISSICGEKKYDKVREDLKDAIEATQLAEVYTFEKEGASTLSAGTHYSWALEDSDICIFLIDNADGIRPGVQAEIDIVNKRNIKALYYFCDEKSTKKTPLEQSLIGAQYAKSKTVHHFDELSKNGAKDLINDIITIYHYYCAGKFTIRADEVESEIHGVSVVGSEKYKLQDIPKTVVKNVDKTSNYILTFILGAEPYKDSEVEIKTSDFDDWGLQFLPILFEAKSIKSFNSSMYLDLLKTQQEKDFYDVVEIRWRAIQSFFLGDIDKCVQYLEDALEKAKVTNQPIWMIKDILIDLRNHHWIQCTSKNRFYESVAQQELTESDQELYYPILDRIHESLHEKFVEGLYKSKVESPYTVTIGNSLNQYGELIASSLIVSMYNGSLTHILLIYDKLKELAFYLSGKYDDWNFRLVLYKLLIYFGKEKEVKGLGESYPELLNKLSSDEANSIMEFCDNHPIEYKRITSKFLAFGTVGYFLDDEKYELYEKIIINEIEAFLDRSEVIVEVGQSIFKCLLNVAYRMKQDDLAKICCVFMDKHYSRWYTDMFSFIEKRIDINKMSKNSAEEFIKHIIQLLDTEKGCEQVKFAPMFLCVLRKQNHNLTDKLDMKIAEKLEDFYENTYKLETTENDTKDLPYYIRKYTQDIQERNETQGKGGIYRSYGTRHIATVRAILLQNEFECDNDVMDSLIATVANTLLVSKEGILTKLDATALLIYIALNCSDDYERNKHIYESVYECNEEIVNNNHSIISTNIDYVSLKIYLQLLYTVMGKDTYSDIIELIPYIHDDTATIITVTNSIVEMLEVSETAILPEQIESVILQNTLHWIHADNLNIRWNATRILLLLGKNKANYRTINNELIRSIDSGSVHIKTLILRQMIKLEAITPETKDYIIMRCSEDANYIVRMVCEEIQQ